MSTNLPELIPLRERVITTALKIAAAEREISDDPASLNVVLKLDRELFLACRDATNAIDDLPPGRHPRGWAT